MDRKLDNHRENCQAAPWQFSRLKEEDNKKVKLSRNWVRNLKGKIIKNDNNSAVFVGFMEIYGTISDMKKGGQNGKRKRFIRKRQTSTIL